MAGTSFEVPAISCWSTNSGVNTQNVCIFRACWGGLVTAQQRWSDEDAAVA